MAGLQQMANQGAMQQSQVQADPRITQAIEQIYAQQVMPMMPEGEMYGAGRFLSGPSIPMTFNSPVPQYESPTMTPGDFASFVSAIRGGTAEKPVIPVYDSATGTYKSSGLGLGLNAMFGGGSNDIVGYNADGSKVYASAPSNPFTSFVGNVIGGGQG
jgi:hypothetical protein